jgi:hypothetical protein
MEIVKYNVFSKFNGVTESLLFNPKPREGPSWEPIICKVKKKSLHNLNPDNSLTWPRKPATFPLS